MENSHNLYDTLYTMFSQAKWRDKRHLQAVIWMITGLIESGLIGMTQWAIYADTRAQFVESTVRRFSRWMSNDRIDVHTLYAPIITSVLTEWSEEKLYLALDSSMLWDKYCLIRVALVYRGRTVPLAWKIIEHGSATVAFDAYKPVLDAAAAILPFKCKVILLADRGFADTGLMAYCDEYLRWDWRIRCKKDFILYRPGKKKTKVGNLRLKVGQARFLHGVHITGNRFGPVHLALGRAKDSKEAWYVVSSEPTELASFEEYGKRFDIEESFLDDKSNGFQLESSRLRKPAALERLCFVLALTTLFLVSQGTAVVDDSDKSRRWVDSHWSRGNSYLKIGWQWVKRAAIKGWPLIQSIRLSPLPDPEPCFASKSCRDKPLFQFDVSYETYGKFAT